MCSQDIKNMAVIPFSFKEDAGVQKEGIAIIALLLTDIEFLRAQCVTEHLYLSVLDAMRKFPDNAELIEISFEAIGMYLASL